jgi:hypothetical protein
MEIKLTSLDEAQKELKKLAKKELVSDKAWSPYQTFVHCAKTIDYFMPGCPTLKPAIIRNTVGKLSKDHYDKYFAMHIADHLLVL